MKNFKNISIILLALILFTNIFPLSAYASSLPDNNMLDEQVIEELMEDFEGFEEDFLIEDENLILEEAIEDILEISDEEIGEIADKEVLEEELGEGHIKTFGFFDDFGALYQKKLNKIMEIKNLIESQYRKNKVFINNTSQSYKLAREITYNLKSNKEQLVEIIRDENRSIGLDEYGQILKINEELKNELDQNNYIIGQIARESRIYISAVRNKDIRGAIQSFDRILELQSDKLLVLDSISKHSQAINKILINSL